MPSRLFCLGAPRCRIRDFIGRARKDKRTLQKVFYDVDDVSESLGSGCVSSVSRRVACVCNGLESCLFARADESAIDQAG